MLLLGYWCVARRTSVGISRITRSDEPLSVRSLVGITRILDALRLLPPRLVSPVLALHPSPLRRKLCILLKIIPLGIPLIRFIVPT
jgi:hypothetical protein